MEIRAGILDHPAVAALVRHHQGEARASTPQENAHALDAGGLAAADVRFFAGWLGDEVVAIGALRYLDDAHAELKSMRVAPAHCGRGHGRAMLDHLVATAQAAGMTRVSLETGTAPMFAAANRLYERYGFNDGPAFGGYPPSPHNRFMTMALPPAAAPAGER